MPHPFQRTQRIGDEIQKALAGILNNKNKISDPRFQSLSITGIDLSPDLKNATIFVSRLEEDSLSPPPEAPASEEPVIVGTPKESSTTASATNIAIKQTITALNKAAGFFRYMLAKELMLRHTPKLTFIYDNTLKYGSELTQLINQVNQENHD